jgi:CubicO group peptidase (beta-lactamase class C family)
VNATSIILGLIVEKAGGKPLDVLADEIFFKPLAMDSTTFHPATVPNDRVVPTERDDWRGRMVHGEVHDETAYTLSREIVPGNAGLFSTVPDLLTFLEMLLSKGTYRGKRYFSESTVDQMQTNQLRAIGGSAGLGWELCQKTFMGNFITPHAFGKSGFTGCLVVCDIPKCVGIVILSNVVYPKRPADRSAINELRRDVSDIVFQG